VPSQHAKAGARLLRGSRVSVVLSRGPLLRRR
jgi:hypothetical protein